MKFYDFDFTDEMLDSLESMRFETPTPVQEQTIPVIMTGRDLIACAQTGTGKTAAYLLPIIDDIVRSPHEGIDTVILVPTRELAIQIDQQMEGFGYFVPVSSTAIYGGSDSGEWSRQRTALTEGADIVITTPGRMLQHISMGYVDFSHVTHLVLDEADRMLDMGFYDDIMQVVKLIDKEKRQTLLFSATMPPKIRDLAKTILKDPEEISIAIAKPAEGIRQVAYPIYETQKIGLVTSILKQHVGQSIIIFSSRKQSVRDLGRTLKSKGFNSDIIYSDLEQVEREEVLRRFRNRSIDILVATDILARGIDIPDIDMVINYDVPRDADDYVHRIGRTARAASKGEAATLIVPAEMRSFGRIESLIGQSVEKLALPSELGEAPAYDPNLREPKKNGDHRKSSHGAGKRDMQPRRKGEHHNPNKPGNHPLPKTEGDVKAAPHKKYRNFKPRKDNGQ